MKSYDDTLFSVPYRCDDKDCKYEWHTATYWICFKGKRTSYSVDWYTDGDHESCSRKELPTQDEINKAWREYSQYVLETGTDPLGEFNVKREQRSETTWTVRLHKSIVGMVIYSARNRAGTVMPKDFPAYLSAFLNMKGHIADGLTESDLRDSTTGKVTVRNGGGVFFWTGKIEHTEPRSEAAVTRDLRKAARRHLAQKEG